jgi:transposase-like protein
MSKRRKFSPEFKRGAVEQARQPTAYTGGCDEELTSDEKAIYTSYTPTETRGSGHD